MGKINIRRIEQEAFDELSDERSAAAKVKIKAKIQELERARKIVANLEAEYELLLKDLGSDG